MCINYDPPYRATPSILLPRPLTRLNSLTSGTESFGRSEHTLISPGETGLLYNHHRMHKNSLIVSVPTKMNPANNPTKISFNIQFNIIQVLQSVSFPSDVPEKNLYLFLIFRNPEHNQFILASLVLLHINNW